MNPPLIAYKDFLPTRAFRFGGMRPLDEAVWMANRWIAEASASVINVETITIPIFGDSVAMVRVWHRAPDLQRPRTAADPLD